MFKKLLSLSFALVVLPLQAYEINTVFAGSKFAVHQVILEEDEKVSDDVVMNRIKNELISIQHVRGFFHTSAAIFPANSKGFAGRIKDPLSAVITISSYGGDKELVDINTKVNSASQAGLYINSDLLNAIIDNRQLQPLLMEFYSTHIPLIISNLKIDAFGPDINNNFYITTKDKHKILDIQIVDSVYYNRAQMYRLNDKCTVSIMGLVDRMVNTVPIFMSMHASVNYMDCPNQGQQDPKPKSKSMPKKQVEDDLSDIFDNL